MLPFLLAERGPLWDADLRGAYLGIRQHHTRAHFIRAAVEGVAFQLATILDGLDEVEPVTSIRATGGAFRSELWREILAGVLDRPLTVTAGAEGSALGAAALGLYAIGVGPTLEESREQLAPGIVGPRADGARGRGIAAELRGIPRRASLRGGATARSRGRRRPPRRPVGVRLGQHAATVWQQDATRCWPPPTGPSLGTPPKAKKPWPTKEFGPMSTITKEQIAESFVNERLPKRSIVGFGFGDFANNLAFTSARRSCSTTTPTSRACPLRRSRRCSSSCGCGTPFADIFAGRLVDRTMTRLGKFRPFILFGGVPLLFLSSLTFHVPAEFDDGAKLLYAYLTYAILGLSYSLVNIPYGSLASAMTQSVHQRAKLVASRFFGSAIGGIVLTYIIAPKISDLRGAKATLSSEAYRAEVQSIFTQTTLLFVLIGSIAYGLTVYFVASRSSGRQPRVSAPRDVGHDPDNKPLGYLCAASFFYLIGLFAVGGASAFYAQYVMGDIKWLGPITSWSTPVSRSLRALHPQARRPARQEVDLPVVRRCSPSSAAWRCSSCPRVLSLRP